jgi:hypothetical protein
MTKRKYILILPCLLFAFITTTAAACGNDASVDTRDKGSAKAIINMPNHFPSIAIKCRGKKGVYTTNNTAHGSGSPFVVLNDPECSS